VSSLSLGTPVTLPAGSVVEITQASTPPLNALVTAAQTASLTVPVIPFIPGANYGTATATATVNPYTVSYPFASNQWAPSNSCQPGPGSSAAFQGLTYNAAYVSC
jgi:hypothetical protein